MFSLPLKVKKLNERAILPTKAYEYDSGWDIYSCLEEDIILKPSVYYQENLHNITSSCLGTPISTGIAIQLPDPINVDFLGITLIAEAVVRPRSGLAFKNQISCHIGTIDSGYRSECKLFLYNFGTSDFVVKHGMKLAQLVVQLIPNTTLVEVSELNDSDRGVKGFGSSDHIKHE